MSRLDELIAELCPNGVEYKPLEKLCKTNIPPKKIQSKNIKDVGDYPVIDQSAEFISGFTNDKQAILPKNEYIIFGDHTESIKFVDFAFAQGADGIKILTSVNCNCKYLYYCFSNNYVKTGKYTRHWSDAKLTLIPVPPLPIQQEIVRILDNFTELTAELTTELTAELEARQKQYEYYRDKLLSFKEVVAGGQTGKLGKLIAEFCPEGVEYKRLGEIGYFYGGLSGKSKYDFANGNAKFITYMNVYSNLAVDTEISEMVKIGENEKQNTVKHGDILFTGSSETLDECGISSVLTKETNEKLYLNSFCFGFRLIDKDLLLPDFSKYLFRSKEIRKQIKRTASGVTRFNVSKKKMEQVVIPVPPLPIQQEIVRILDNFTELTAELTTKLTTELEARQKQYEYYRDKLLSFKEATA
jgi:type I restriction enzyme S subunit